jgi:hypothetical protein
MSAMLLACAVCLAATDPAQPMDLLTAVDTGQVRAEFRGAGDSAVTGVVERLATGPTSLEIQPGTQFWAQAGGRQGQSTVGSVPIDLNEQRLAYVSFSTVCTNIGRPAPTPDDIMLPVASPDERMVALLSLSGIQARPHDAVQAAAWAVASNPRYYEVRAILASKAGSDATATARGAYAEQMIALGADLARAAGLEPSQFRLFR